jgi:hypothetical protein
VPGTQPAVDGAQFMVPSGAGVAAGVAVLAGVVVRAPGADVGAGVVGVTTPGVAGIAVPGAEGAAAPVPDAPAASAESIVQVTAKHAMAKNAPPCRRTGR